MKKHIIFFMSIMLISGAIFAQNVVVTKTEAKTTNSLFKASPNAKSVNDSYIVPQGITPAGKNRAIIFEDNFSTNTGWTLGTSWAIAAAVAEPAADHTQLGDNGIMACPLGVDYPNNMTRTEALSPVINCASASTLVLSFWSFSGCESNSFDHMGIEVYNGTSWVPLWANGASFQEASWTYYEFDVSAHAAGNSNFQIRFFIGPTDNSVTYSGWAIDDLAVSEPDAHDLGVTNILPTMIPSGSTVNPQVTIYNYGASNESTWSVTLTDGGSYNSTISNAATINALTSYNVVMDPWTPADGAYTLTAYVTVTGDTDNTNDTLSVTCNVLPIQLSYGWNAYGGTVALGPLTVELPGGALSSIATSADDFMAGADFVEDEWFACQYSAANNSNIYIIDKITGALTLVGASGVSLTGLAYDHANGILYGSAWQDPNSVLYTINTSTGVATLVGNINTDLIIGIAADISGTIYGIGIINDNLYTINSTTGAGTLVGPLGVDISYAQDIAFDRDNDILYGTLYTSDGVFGTINTSTGAFTQTAVITSEVTGFAIPYTFAINNHDIGVTALVAPTSGELTNAETVTVTIENFGTSAETGFDVALQIDGGTVETQTVSATVNPGATIDYTFTGTFDFSATGAINVVSWTELATDEDNTNDTLDVSINNTTSIFEASNTTFEVYPNPAKDYVQIVAENIITKIEIYNMNGQLVFKSLVGAKQYHLNAESFANGMYSIKVYNENGVSAQQIMISK